MSRRIDIELTSERPDGTWTWRAVGARQPRGAVDAALLFDGAKTGDVVRAEADFEIEGISILSVIPPKEKKRSEPQRIEILGTGGPDAPGVTTQLLAKGGRGGGDRDGGGRRDRPERSRGEAGAREGSARPQRSDERAGRPSGREGEARAGRPERDGGSASRRASPPPGEKPGAPPVAGRDGTSDDLRAGHGPGHSRGPAQGSGRSAAGRSQAGRPAGPSARAKDRRMVVGNEHRAAVLDVLAPEERVVAEHVLRGGIPAVRTALHLEREKAGAEGRPAPDADALVTFAERLLPRLRTAEWHDRAEAAIKAPDEVSLRDLRSVVAGADAARNDETRTLASTLRDALEGRLTHLRVTWSEEVEAHLSGGRVIRAVRLSGRPPEPSSRLPQPVLDELAAQAGAAMTPETAPDSWLAMLEAVAASPVRRQVKPAGLPKAPHPDVDRVARQQSGRVPALATLLGISIPPPPGPRRRLPEGGSSASSKPPLPPPPPPAPAPSQPLSPGGAPS